MMVMPNDTTLIWVATRAGREIINILIIDLTVLETHIPIRQGNFHNIFFMQTSRSLLLSEDKNYIYLGYVDVSYNSFGIAKLNYITNITLVWDFETYLNIPSRENSVKRIFVRNN